MDAFAAIIKRETDKEARGKQNTVIKELDPLIFTLHLGSMKIFFSNIETEEKTVDGEVLGELDQVLVHFFCHLESRKKLIKVSLKKLSYAQMTRENLSHVSECQLA